MESSLRAGITLYTAGDVHAAHEPWEAVWLDLSAGDDEKLFHGLIQFVGSVYHAESRNWSGAVGLAECAQQYLRPLPTPYRGVDTNAIVTTLERLATDPERIEREPRPPLRYKNRALCAADCDLAAITTATTVLAARDDYDEAIVRSAIEYAHAEVETAQSTWIGLLATFVDERQHRALVYDRLRRRVERRRQRERDVAGLFD